MTPIQMLGFAVTIGALWHGFGGDAAVAYVGVVAVLFEDGL